MSDDATFESGDPAPTAQRIALNAKLRRACHAIRAAAVIWVLWGLGLTLWTWGRRDDLLSRLEKLYGLDASSVTDLGYWSAVALVLASWLPSAALVIFIWRLARIYLDGRVFTVEAAARLRSVALAGFFAAGVVILTRPFTVALISSDLMAKLPLQFWLNPNDLLYFLISGFLLALAVIFKTAAEIADEHARFV